MLIATQLSQSFGSRRVLDGVEVALHSGVTALLGINGAGKSTLLTALAGGQRPTAGTVTADGLDLYGRRSIRTRALKRIALMPQSTAFPGQLTVREVVEYLTWMRGATTHEARSAADDAIRRVLLTDRADSRVATLSGGMLRRVGLAQAIASGAQYVLLDEPSTGLDPEQRRVMVTLLGELGGSVLLSSHVMEDVVDLADRVLILSDTTIAFDGTFEELADRSPHGVTQRRVESGFLAVLAESRSPQDSP